MTSPTGPTAIDYSTAQQLITTAWNVAVAILLVVLVFGWTGGKQLVGVFYTDAKGGSPSRRNSERRSARRSARSATDRCGAGSAAAVTRKTLSH